MIPKRSLLGFNLILATAVALSACEGDDDGGVDASADTGVNDTGSNDTGVTDTGTNDTGVVDTGTLDTGVDLCLVNNTVDVDGTDVVVDEATDPPVTGGATNAVLSCRHTPPPAFSDDYCIVECIDFLGYDPSPAEVQQLEFAVFPLFDLGAMIPIDADPTYDRNTGIDNDPAHRSSIGFIVTSPPNSECDSGYQLEMGFTGGPGAGAETLLAEVPYVVRVRSTQTSTSAWVDSYHWNFVRRNDETPDVPACGINEARTPSIRYVFPVLHRSLLQDAISNAGVALPGSGNLDDGLGTGYALVEARDCSSGGGVPMGNATLGMTPAPLSDVYPGDAFELNRTATFTSEIGYWLALGFAGMTATSSASLDVVGAVGVSSDGTCTEAFAGSDLPIYPDSVTFLRFNRDNSLVE